MADETYAGANIHHIYAGGDPATKWKAMGEAVYPGDVIRIHSDDKIYACKSTDLYASGVMGLTPGQDIDTIYTVTSGKLYPYYPVGQKTLVWVRLEATSPAVAVRDGSFAIVGTEDGKVRAWAYTDAAEATDTLSTKVGRVVDIDAGHVSDDHIIKINLGG